MSADEKIQIRANAAILLRAYGYSVNARIQIVSQLMQEHQISSTSALMFLNHAKRKAKSCKLNK